MRKRKISKRNTRIRRESDPIPWKYCVLTLVCGLILVAGFFWAAKQHFASMNFGIKNAKLREQIEELKKQKRRLVFQRESALSPEEIEKVAAKMGFRKMTFSNVAKFETKKKEEKSETRKKESKAKKDENSPKKTKQETDKNTEKKQVKKKEVKKKDKTSSKNKDSKKKKQQNGKKKKDN